MALVIAYLFCVGLGPVIFLGLIRPAPGARRFAMGCASAVMLMGTAWLMQALGATLGWLACLWLGWLVTLAMVVQAVTLRHGRGRPRKWSAALGAAASVAPWLGLSLALSTG